jgi:AcrR family transcriptional regulator
VGHLTLERARDLVATVPELCHGLEHARAGLVRDQPGVAQHVGDRRHRHAGVPGDVDHGGAQVRRGAQRAGERWVAPRIAARIVVEPDWRLKDRILSLEHAGSSLTPTPETISLDACPILLSGVQYRSGVQRTSIEEVRQRELIEATLRMVSDVGFGRVTIRNVAREAGASVGSVHYYFANKDELLRAAIVYSEQRWREHLTAHLEGLQGTMERLQRVAELCFPGKVAEPDPAWNLFIEFWHVASQQREVADVIEAGTASWLELLTTLLEEGVAAGELRLHGTARNEAVRLAALIDGLAIHTRVAPYLTETDARALLLERFRELQATPGEAAPVHDLPASPGDRKDDR